MKIVLTSSHQMFECLDSGEGISSLFKDHHITTIIHNTLSRKEILRKIYVKVHQIHL